RSRDLGEPRLVSGLLINLGCAARFQGDYCRAAALFAEALAMYREMEQPRGIALALAGFAGVAAGMGQPEQAARLLGATEALLASIGAAMWPADRLDHERNLTAARADLDE